MKYVKIHLQPIKIKADLEDLETLQVDLYEHVTSLIESETLSYDIVDEEEDEEDER